jgi:hypothetical protein
MDTRIVVPKGVWYEKRRDRWRVKLFCDGVLFHRSYHRQFNDALAAWQSAKKQMIRPRPIVPLSESSIQNRFLCQPRIAGMAEFRG